MDIASLSIAMTSQQVRGEASVAVMNNVKRVMEQQGDQLVGMLQQSVPTPSHPSLGNMIDAKA